MAAKKTSNLKIVKQQTAAHLQAVRVNSREFEEELKAIRDERDRYRLTDMQLDAVLGSSSTLQISFSSRVFLILGITLIACQATGAITHILSGLLKN
jgi:hypothetical protein